MKQAIEIEVPDGKVAVWEDGKVVFKDAKPPLPKTWEEFVKTQDYDELQIITRVPEDITLQHIALIQLHQLRDCYRQGWLPRKRGYEENNWCIYRTMFNSGSMELSMALFNYDRFFLSFPTKELATEFLNNFRYIIEQAGDLI